MTGCHNERVVLSRRGLVAGTIGLAAAAWASPARRSQAQEQPPQERAPALRGNIRHSVVRWCFADHWNLEQMCQAARQLGCQSVELVSPDEWPVLHRHGLGCAIAPAHGFVQGMNNPQYQEGCIDLLRRAIDASAPAKVPNVISFTGFAYDTGPWQNGRNPDLSRLPEAPGRIDPDEGIRHCVRGYKKIVGHAERLGVTIALEMLNSRVDTAMKGHPGYQGDHVEYCMEIIRQVGSPRLGLLFDVYHVQIMDGDLISRIRQYAESIVHVHTAGVPGRGELDDRQEINYRPVMQALWDGGYRGFVGHEFIPTRDPAEGLAEAIAVCDV